MSTARFATAIGECAMSWSEAGVTGFSLPENLLPEVASAPASYPAPALSLSATLHPDLPAEIAVLIDRVRGHLCGDLQDFRDVRFDWEAVTPFRQRVLRAVLAVGPGHTATYGQITAAIGAAPSACRATGGAVGANPWPLLIPCHRILGANGKLTGYSATGGLRTKARLLAIEGVEQPAG